MRFFRVRFKVAIGVCIGVLIAFVYGAAAYGQESAVFVVEKIASQDAETVVTAKPALGKSENERSSISTSKKNASSFDILVQHEVVKAGKKSSAVPVSNCVVKPYVSDDTKTEVNTSTKIVFENGVEVLKKRTVADNDTPRKVLNFVADNYENVVKNGSTKETIREFSSSGKWSIRTCTNPDGSTTTDIFPVGVIDPYVLIAQAIETIAVQPPPVEMNDTGLGAQITQRGTVLWVDETYWNQPRSETVSAGPVSVTVTLTPRSTTWDMGDGETHYCDTNEPWNNDFSREPEQYACHHVYEMATRKGEPYTIAATTNFSVTAVTNTGQNLPVPDLQATGTVETQVDEIQALVVPTPGQYSE